MIKPHALTLWRADLARFSLDDKALCTGRALIARHAS